GRRIAVDEVQAGPGAYVGAVVALHQDLVTNLTEGAGRRPRWETVERDDHTGIGARDVHRRARTRPWRQGRAVQGGRAPLRQRLGRDHGPRRLVDEDDRAGNRVVVRNPDRWRACRGLLLLDLDPRPRVDGGNEGKLEEPREVGLRPLDGDHLPGGGRVLARV